MKIIYNTVLQLLDEIEALRWKDKDKGQLKFARPAIAYPAALIKIDLPKCDDLGGNIQDCTALVTIRIAFDFAGETSANTPDAIRQQALAYYDTVDAVYAKFQGFENSELGKFSRKKAYEEDRDDGINVMVLPFETDFRDITATL